MRRRRATNLAVESTLPRPDIARCISYPANRRSIFDNGQYGDRAGGVGYTITQGLRLGVSAYRGPYLDYEFPYYFPGEANPHVLPATAIGVDGQWGRGPWNVYGEWQRKARLFLYLDGSARLVCESGEALFGIIVRCIGCCGLRRLAMPGNHRSCCVHAKNTESCTYPRTREQYHRPR